MNRKKQLALLLAIIPILSWNISSRIHSTKYTYSVFDILAPSFFIKLKSDGKVVENQNVNQTILDVKIHEKDVSISLSNFRGRGVIWSNHIEFIKSFSINEALFGTSRKVPLHVEPEPHNQIIDWLERYGIVGTVLFLSLLIIFFVKVPILFVWKLSAIMVVLLYANITEIFVMPTFIWWMGTYLCLPLLTYEFRQFSKL